MVIKLGLLTKFRYIDMKNSFFCILNFNNARIQLYKYILQWNYHLFSISHTCVPLPLAYVRLF